MSEQVVYREIDVIEVPREQLSECGGQPWDELYARAESDPVLLIRRTLHNDGQIYQVDHPSWKPRLGRDNKELAYLPLGKAWLRKIDGRAFLYAQNW